MQRSEASICEQARKEFAAKRARGSSRQAANEFSDLSQSGRGQKMERKLGRTNDHAMGADIPHWQLLRTCTQLNGADVGLREVNSQHRNRISYCSESMSFPTM